MAKKKIVKTNAIRMVEQKKIPYTEHEYEWDENHLSASSVAEQLPESQSRIFKTLVAVGNVTGPLVAVIPGEAELNLKTGYIRGGCSPIGMKKLFPTYLDQIAENYDQIIVSAGRRGLQMELAPQDICALTSGQFADIKQ